MRSFQNWRIKESTQSAEWQQLKLMKLPVSQDAKAFVAPRIGKIQEAMVAKLHESNPKIQNFRDVPPELRDQFAQAIVAATMELFFSGMESQPQQQPQQTQQPQQQQPAPLPQDEPQTPAASRG